MTWLMGLAGQLKSGSGLTAPLLSHDQRAADVHFGFLDNGDTALLHKTADQYVDLRGRNTAEMLKRFTPWTGEYKCYMIVNDKGDGHGIGAYFPWTGSNKFFDPNLVAGDLVEDKWLWELLALWPQLYTGVGSKPGATWGYEGLYVFNDPKKALSSLM